MGFASRALYRMSPGELGKLRPSNIRQYDRIDYIAIEPDRRRVREEQDGPTKRVKTASSKRDIPVHPVLIEAGFLDFVATRRAEGLDWLFTELESNKYGSRTQRLSRVINDFLDGIGLSDPELMFQSFRHTGKRAIRGKAPGEIVDLLFGHADGSVSSKYGRERICGRCARLSKRSPIRKSTGHR